MRLFRLGPSALVVSFFGVDLTGWIFEGVSLALLSDSGLDVVGVE